MLLRTNIRVLYAHAYHIEAHENDVVTPVVVSISTSVRVGVRVSRQLLLYTPAQRFSRPHQNFVKARSGTAEGGGAFCLFITQEERNSNHLGRIPNTYHSSSVSYPVYVYLS